MAEVKGGDQLAIALARIGAKLSRKPALRVGFLEGATYPDGTLVALVAAVQDFGAPAAGIPPRPFFRNMVWTKQNTWPKVLAAGLKVHNYDVVKALSLVGELIRGQLQQAIRDFDGVPLAASTIARKGFDKQLIHTSHMINSVDYEVRE